MERPQVTLFFLFFLLTAAGAATAVYRLVGLDNALPVYGGWCVLFLLWLVARS